MISRREILKTGAAGVAAGLTGAGAASGRKPKKPPNFIIILADDLGYGDLSSFGSPNIKTPRIDALGADGLKLTCVYAEPFCGPARAAIMTGSYPIRIAEPSNTKSRHTILHDQEITLAEVLKPAGYKSAMIGKWGLGGHSNNRWRPELQPPSQGFDVHFGTPASNDWPEDVRLLRNAEVIEQPPELDTLTGRYADEAINFIKSNKKNPFFVYLCPNMPHTALAASENFLGKSDRGLYGDVIEEIDFHVGRIVDALEDEGLAEDTYVIFTSDNGPWIVKREEGGSAGPFRGGKMALWEGGVRVPGVVWAPGRIEPGRVSSEMVALQDFLPTLASMAGAALPTDRTIDGLDLSAFINGKTEESPRQEFAYYLWTHLQAVRKGRWKLHLPRPEDPAWVAPLEPTKHLNPEDAAAVKNPMLFDIKTDFRERYNVADENPGIVKDLFDYVEEIRDELGDYDRTGAGVRFFDPYDSRPEAPVRYLR